MKSAAKRFAAPVSALLLSLSACSPAQILNATVPEGGLSIARDVPYGGLARQTLDIYRPAGGTAGLPVVVFFYGGSWNSGSKAMYPFVAATLARSGMVVVVPDYRVYPAVRYPAFLQDCALAVAWTRRHPAQTGAGPLFLMGHSAGAYNALMLALDPAWLRGAGEDPADVAGAIGLAGPYDFLPITDPEIKPIFPDAGPETQPITYAAFGAATRAANGAATDEGKDAGGSPAAYLGGSLGGSLASSLGDSLGGGWPQVLLLTGSDDHQVRPRNTMALAAKLHVTPIVYKGLGHIGLITAFAPAFQWRAPVLRDVVVFIRKAAADRSLRPAGHASP